MAFRDIHAVVTTELNLLYALFTSHSLYREFQSVYCKLSLNLIKLFLEKIRTLGRNNHQLDYLILK